MFWRKKPTPTYTRNQQLSARPLRNPMIRWETDESGTVVLQVPLKKTGILSWLSRKFHLPDERKVELDELGTTVWELCDGKHTVDAIVQRLMRHYKFERREAEASLFAYLNTLQSRRYILLLQVKKQPRVKKR